MSPCNALDMLSHSSPHQPSNRINLGHTTANDGTMPIKSPQNLLPMPPLFIIIHIASLPLHLPKISEQLILIACLPLHLPKISEQLILMACPDSPRSKTIILSTQPLPYHINHVMITHTSIHTPRLPNTPQLLTYIM